MYRHTHTNAHSDTHTHKCTLRYTHTQTHSPTHSPTHTNTPSIRTHTELLTNIALVQQLYMSVGQVYKCHQLLLPQLPWGSGDAVMICCTDVFPFLSLPCFTIHCSEHSIRCPSIYSHPLYPPATEADLKDIWIGTQRVRNSEEC